MDKKEALQLAKEITEVAIEQGVSTSEILKVVEKVKKGDRNAN